MKTRQLNGTISLAALLLMTACSGEPAQNASAETQDPAQTEAGTPAASTARDLTLWPETESHLIDGEIESRIDDLLSKLTLEQKVGQVIQADNASITPEEVKEYRIGSVLSGGNSAPDGKPYANVEEWVAATDAYYKASVDPEGVDVAIPILWGIDAVHGHNNVVGGTLFPHNIGLGAMRNPDLMEEIARVTALELRVTGHDWTFAPTVAVPRDDRWGRSYEGFGEDPEIVASYSPRIVEGLQGEFGSDVFLDKDHVISTAKHFLGDGGTEDGIDQGDAILSEAELVRLHNAGYPPAIEAGALSVMASFSSWNGKKVTGDPYLLNDVLKERMGFDGFIVGDWNAHGQIEGCTNTDCPEALNAGLDMYMAPDSWRGLYESTLEQARSGEIPMERLDDAVRRILRAKLHFGVFEEGTPSERALAGQEDILGSDEHRTLARQAVRESLVLLKNDGVLPITPDKRILVAGDGADNISKQSGGWTLTWQGGGADNAEFPNASSILEGIEKAASSVEYSPEGTYSETPDVAIVVFGEEPYAEFRGDVDHLAYDLSGSKELTLLKELQAEGIPVVSVFLSGRPMWVNRELNASDAFVAAWLPGSEGGGVADLLIANEDGEPRHDFKGTLSFSWPRQPDQTPLNVGDEAYDPLFAYGYGLSYANPGTLEELNENVSSELSASEGQSIFFAEGGFVGEWKANLSDEVSQTRVDHQAQEDAIQFSFPSEGGQATFTDGQTHSYVRESNADIELALTLKAAAADSLDIGMLCEGDDCAAYRTFTSTDGQWTDVRISLSCFSDINLEQITAPLAIRSEAAAEVSVSDVRLAEDADGQETCDGE
ncbi:glycoside hydrolase family 3 protein [Henriciella sp.]|uniref:glycoside hydrolase family 3 protein n=1 Tax=Henriciella sp. TaxID=1968823 RepID=UPI00260BE5E4|nr:glycoside hydrolase family 3 protein [Henriciella sp.]